MAKTKAYKGAGIEISFEMARCIHARNCYLKLPQVFDPARRPWVSPDAASPEEIAAMIRTCPSGALGYRRLDDAEAETPPGINRMTVSENGPNAFHGDLTVAGEEMTRATLCRCGQSKNMPYCDYSHVEAGFQATGEPAETGKDVEIESNGGPLELIPHENGPLEVKGALEITTGTGRHVHTCNRAFICRCGRSSRKPYCDGSHKTVRYDDEA